MNDLNEFHTALRKRLESVIVEMDGLLDERNQLDDRLRILTDERSHIQSLLGLREKITSQDATSAELPTEPTDLVVRVLQETGRPLHYREIERELRARSWYVAGGADPANTLLAKYFNDPRLYRPARGMYAIRPPGGLVTSVGTKRKAPRRRK